MAKDRIDAVLDDWCAQHPEFSTTEELGVVLRIQVLAKILADQLDDTLGHLDLEWWEYDVLSVLRRQGPPFQLTASGIVEGTMLSPGALTNRIDRLIERSLVTRAEDPGDRRRVLITLSPEGRKLVDKAAEERFECAKKAVSSFSADQKKQLNGLLRKLLQDVKS